MGPLTNNGPLMLCEFTGFHWDPFQGTSKCPSFFSVKYDGTETTYITKLQGGNT